MQLNFRSTPAWRQRYQQLLTDEWSWTTLVATKDFLFEQLERAGLRLRFADADEEPPPEKPSLYPIPASASDDLRDHLESLNYHLNLEYEKRRQSRRPAAADRDRERLALSVSLLLAFPAWPLRSDTAGEPIRPEIAGNVDFFDDGRSILYLCAAHELLPELEGPRWSSARTGLLHAMYTHTSLVWQKSPAHQHYLYSVFFDCIGQPEQAAEELFRAFTSTAPAEHDYFTRAFAYWAYEAERGKIEEATRFAFRLHREVPREYLVDAEDLVRQSVSLGLSGAGHRRVPRSPKR